VSAIFNQISKIYLVSCVSLVLAIKRNASVLLFLAGAAMVSGGMMEFTYADGPEPPSQSRPAEAAFGRPAEVGFSRPALPAFGRPAEFASGSPAEAAVSRPAQNADIPFQDTLIRNATGNLFRFIEGAFGALLVVSAGLGAIIAAILGAYRTAFSLLVVAVGAFILRAYVSLFFGTNYPAYDVGNQFVSFETTVPIGNL